MQLCMLACLVPRLIADLITFCACLFLTFILRLITFVRLLVVRIIRVPVARRRLYQPFRLCLHAQQKQQRELVMSRKRNKSRQRKKERCRKKADSWIACTHARTCWLTNKSRHCLLRFSLQIKAKVGGLETIQSGACVIVHARVIGY